MHDKNYIPRRDTEFDLWQRKLIACTGKTPTDKKARPTKSSPSSSPEIPIP